MGTASTEDRGDSRRRSWTGGGNSSRVIQKGGTVGGRARGSADGIFADHPFLENW